MVQCKVCGGKLNSMHGLALHISAAPNHPTREEYYVKYINNPGQCEHCGQPTKFKNLVKGFSRFCCISCFNKSDEHKEKIRKTNIEKYGCECVFQNEEIKEKIKETNLKKYGSEHNSGCREVIEKRIKTWNKTLGVSNPFASEAVRAKSKQTMISRYGTDCYIKSKEGRQKAKQTCIEKYGVDNVFKSPDIKMAIAETNKQRFLDKLLSSDRLGDIVPAFPLDDYNGVIEKYSWLCKKCGNIFEDHLDNGKVPRCFSCFPYKPIGKISALETEVSNFCKQYFPNLIENSRILLDGNEIDIYIPEISLAIEINGLYWHSENGGGKRPGYHLEKTKKCENKGIQLIHIFEDEWHEKQHIVKSILKSKMGAIENKIHGRKCVLKLVDNNEAQLFLDNNHLQGRIGGSHYGLYYNNELVSVLTIGKPRFNKKYCWEILRFCNKIDTVVVGGYSKLLKGFQQTNLGKIITYIDMRYSNGKSHLNLGFSLIGASAPNYHYTKKYVKRESRLKYQKHKLSNILENYSPQLTEWENMQQNGYDRIWDCGNIVAYIK